MWLRWRNVEKKVSFFLLLEGPGLLINLHNNQLSQAYRSGLPCPPPGRSSWPGGWALISCASCTAGIFFSAKPLEKSTASDTALVKRKWHLQERMKPDLRGFFKSQECVASSMLRPLPENLVELVAACPLPPPMDNWGVPWDQLSELDRELVFFMDSRATIIRNAVARRAWHFTQPQLPLYWEGHSWLSPVGRTHRCSPIP